MSHKQTPCVCASSRPKQQLYKTLHSPFTEAHFIIFTFRLFLKHTEDDFNLFLTFRLKQGIKITPGFVPWLMLALSLIWPEQHKHFLAAYFSLYRKPRTSAWCSLCFYCAKLFYHSSFVLKCRRRKHKREGLAEARRHRAAGWVCKVLMCYLRAQRRSSDTHLNSVFERL